MLTMDGEFETLTERLSHLKREGANLLVLSGGLGRTTCHGLLGERWDERRRLYVTTTGTTDRVQDRHWSTTSPERFGQVHVTAGATRATAGRTNGDGEWAPATVSPTMNEVYSQISDPTELMTLARHVHEHLVRFEVHDPDPGEIRLCFDALDTILDAGGRREVTEFLRTLTTRVRLSRGLAHYHLSVATPDQVPEEIEPLFDGVIEQRMTAEGPRQRWTLRESDVQTDWLPLTL